MPVDKTLKFIVLIWLVTGEMSAFDTIDVRWQNTMTNREQV
jgi:hypothetical protein